ncbi:hypothetical protein D3C84_1234840 [compost metagenome]
MSNPESNISSWSIDTDVNHASRLHTPHRLRDDCYTGSGRDQIYSGCHLWRLLNHGST